MQEGIRVFKHFPQPLAQGSITVLILVLIESRKFRPPIFT